ncbi:MAG: hypothetical protein B5M53_04360 [Candidatus Cloacimonas sp. 4484_209]|nr:MAG: hypothetical protein B5M53_04360 [Candidatus Cloacimonas sp. 4484_209]
MVTAQSKKISKRSIQKLIKKPLFEKIKTIGELCYSLGYHCYIVGGTVRDIILGIPLNDIDVVSDGDISLIKKQCMKKWKQLKITESKFGTIKLLFNDNSHIDIAHFRKETYPYPASLPVVQRGIIVDDVKRRDFTINTLLMDIGKINFGKIYDVLSGINDIEKGVIRILHNKSFIDDPTRIFRALRFANRLSFRLDKTTKHLLLNAVNDGYISKLTPVRIRRELFLILMEKNWDKILKDMDKYGILKEIGIKKFCSQRRIGVFKKRISEIASKLHNPLLPKLMLIAHKATISETNQFIDKVGLRKKEGTALLEVKKKGAKTLEKLSKSKISNKDIYWSLKTFDTDAICFLYTLGDKKQRKHICYYLEHLKNIKPKLTGKDLKTLKITEGPIYEKILKQLLNMKLNGKLKSKQQEIDFVKRLFC